jgi:hypothetical protein
MCCSKHRRRAVNLRQHTERLVKQHHLRLNRKRPGQRDSLSQSVAVSDMIEPPPQQHQTPTSFSSLIVSREIQSDRVGNFDCLRDQTKSEKRVGDLLLIIDNRGIDRLGAERCTF